MEVVEDVEESESELEEVEEGLGRGGEGGGDGRVEVAANGVGADATKGPELAEGGAPTDSQGPADEHAREVDGGRGRSPERWSKVGSMLLPMGSSGTVPSEVVGG